jgi:hypothetical protein
MGQSSSSRSVGGRSGVASNPVRVSDFAIFDYGDCENSEERYFRLLKGRWRLPCIAASQKVRLSQARIAVCFCGRKVRDT